MILHCNFEELKALESGAALLRREEGERPSASVAATSQTLAHIALLTEKISGGEISLRTLEEQRWIRDAVAAICDRLQARLENRVVEFHPAEEEAVALYFDYGHVVGVLRRIDEIGSQMTGMIELVTGSPPDDETAAEFEFPG